MLERRCFPLQGTGIISDIGIDYKTNKAKITFLFDNKEVLKHAEDLQKDGILSVEAKKWYKKRSLDANAYCWVLCDKIAKKVGNLVKEDIYKDAIKNIGTFEPMIVEERAFDNFKRIWERQGLGFLIQEVTRKDRCVKVHCYYGSSTYDTKEMSILIDILTQEAKELDIEIKSQEEIKSLLDSWESGANRSYKKQG